MKVFPSVWQRRVAAGEPQDRRADPRAAVALGDFERITALLDQIRELDSALFRMLAKSAYADDLEAFTCLGGPGEGGSSPSRSSPR